MTKTRSDIHRPSAAEFDPALYECIDVIDFKPADGLGDGTPFEIREQHRFLIQRYQEQGYSFASHVGQAHQCGHCGAHIRYAALMARADAQELIYVGETCLDGRFEMTKAEFDRLRKQAELDRAKMAKLAAFNQFLADHPELVPATYAYNMVFLPEEGEFGHEKYGTGWACSVIADILSKLRQYGSISEKQVTFVIKLLIEIEEKIANYTEPEPSGPAPRGKQTVEGEIVGFKTVEGYLYDSIVTKMVVKLDNDSRVYGTVPASLSDAEKGSRIRFTATFEAPRDDAEDFAFFKRPTKAVIL